MSAAEAAKRWAERVSAAQAAFASGVEQGEAFVMQHEWYRWLDTLPVIAPPSEHEQAHK